MNTVFKENTRFRALFASLLLSAIGFGLYKGVIDNYLAEVAGSKPFRPVFMAAVFMVLAMLASFRLTGSSATDESRRRFYFRRKFR